MAPKCGSCQKWIEDGETFIGFPIFRITSVNKSEMTQTEALFHVKCFMRKMKEEQEVILLATSNGHKK